MIKRLLVVGAVTLFMAGMTGCSKDCEVCIGYEGDMDCSIAKDVKKKECEDCAELEGVEAAKAMGFSVTCTVK